MVSKQRLSVDIVVITWNSLDYLKSCLESIYKYTKDISYRLIIIDNGSNDGTSKFLDKLKENNSIIVKTNKRNLGAPKAWSQGYELTTSELVCLVNDDVIVSPHWLSNLVRVMQDNKNLGILGPVRPGAQFLHPYTKTLSKVILEESKLKRKTPWGQLRYFTHGKKYETFVEDYKTANKQILSEFKSLPTIISTCCALVRRTAIKKAGGIADIQFLQYGGEDTDLSWRLIKSGYSLGITSSSYIHHLEHTSMTKNNVDRQKLLKINSRKLYKKWEREIKSYIKTKIKSGNTKEQILQESWLLQRLSDAVGNDFWKNINFPK